MRIIGIFTFKHLLLLKIATKTQPHLRLGPGGSRPPCRRADAGTLLKIATKTQPHLRLGPGGSRRPGGAGRPCRRAGQPGRRGRPAGSVGVRTESADSESGRSERQRRAEPATWPLRGHGGWY